MMPAGLLLVLLAWAADPRSPERRAPGGPSGRTSQASQAAQHMHATTLTACAPRLALAISPLPAPSTLIVPITTIDNPSSQPFSLGVSVVWRNAGVTPRGASGGIEEAIGSVTPYPPSQPGSFVLGVPEAARRLLARRDGQLTLRLTLRPIAADRALAEPLQVTLGDPAWR